MDLEYGLTALFNEHRIFVSEADFQFALAWKLKELYSDVEVRLEYIPWQYDKKMHIDIVLFCGGEMIPIELKYKTRGIDTTIEGERIMLKDQSAQDTGRYDYLYDIHRMEGIMASGQYPISQAYAILLTNDSGYWNKPKRYRITVDDEFRIHEGATLTGNLTWKEHASDGTKQHRKQTIYLTGVYPIAWKTYQTTSDLLFKYTVAKIQTYKQAMLAF